MAPHTTARFERGELDATGDAARLGRGELDATGDAARFGPRLHGGNELLPEMRVDMPGGVDAKAVNAEAVSWPAL